MRMRRGRQTKLSGHPSPLLTTHPTQPTGPRPSKTTAAPTDLGPATIASIPPGKTSQSHDVAHPTRLISPLPLPTPSKTLAPPPPPPPDLQPPPPRHRRSDPMDRTRGPGEQAGQGDQAHKSDQMQGKGNTSNPIRRFCKTVFSSATSGDRRLKGSPPISRLRNTCTRSFMVGTMPIDIKEALHGTDTAAQHAALNKIGSDPELLQEFDIMMFPDSRGSIFSSGGSFFRELFSRKTFPVDDLTSFSGDYDYLANTEMLDHSWEEASSYVKYELALARIQYEMLRNGSRRLNAPSRLLIRRLFYRQKVERDVLELGKRFGNMGKLFQKFEGSTSKSFEELRQCFKQLSFENKKIIEDGLAAIEEASIKDQAAFDAAFEELKAKLSSFEEQFAPFVKDLEKASKSGDGSLFERLKVEMLLRNASYVSGILYNIVCFIRNDKPDPIPMPPAPVPPSPSPVQEDKEVPLVERPPTQHFYKSIGRQNKGLFQKDFALTPSLGCKIKVPVGPDDRSNVSVLVCTGDNKLACKISCAGLCEDKARMTFTSRLDDGFKPKGKVFYAFPFAGVNGHLNASVVYGASPDLKFALTLERLGIVAGGKVVFDPLTKRMKHHEFGASYGPGAVKLLDGDTLKLSLYQGCLSQGVAGGLELTYSRTKEEAAVCGAVEVKVSDGTQVKAKVDSTGAVTAAVQHSLGKGLDVGACVRVRLGEAARYGFSVKSNE